MIPAVMPVDAAATKPPTNGNPWGFPQLDPALARTTMKGLDGTERFVNRLIDRGIDVRVALDRDIKARTFSGDTARAVNLLTKARDYGIGQLNTRHLPAPVVDALGDWVYANRDDERLGVVTDALSDIENTTIDFLDDDGGNVRDEIANMRSEPGLRSWQAVRRSLDWAIASTYALRDSLAGARHVVSAAGLYDQR